MQLIMFNTLQKKTVMNNVILFSDKNDVQILETRSIYFCIKQKE